jgi:hypothetical protein
MKQVIQNTSHGKISGYEEGNKMPAEPGLVISSGRPRVPGSSAVSFSGESKLCDSFAEKCRALATSVLHFKRWPVSSLVDLIDAPGRQADGDSIESQPQALGREQTERADLLILCLEAGETLMPTEESLLRRTNPPFCPLGPCATNLLRPGQLQIGCGRVP